MPVPHRSKKPSILFITGIIEIILSLICIYLLFISGHSSFGLFYIGSFLLLLVFGKKIGWGKVQVFASIYIGVLLFLVLSFVFVLFIITGSGYSNQAEEDIKPILTQISALGVKEICSGGDNGHTIDNTQPWYSIEYLIPHSENITTKIMQIAESNGYPLKEDTDLIKTLKNPPNTVNQSEIYDPRVRYLTADKGSDTLSINIYPFDTYETTYAQQNDASDCIANYKIVIKKIGKNSDVVSISSSLPDPKDSLPPNHN